MGSFDNNLNSEQKREQVLEEFRNAWRQEVKEKHNQDKIPQTSKEEVHNNKKGEEESIATLIETTESLTTKEKEPITAMDHYVTAVDNERQGKLGKGKHSFFLSA